MKKTKILILLFYLSFILAAILNAQTPSNSFKEEGIGETVACGTDTLFYPKWKSSGMESLQLKKGGQEGIAQFFELAQNLTVSGASFYAGVFSETGTNKSVQVTLNLYQAGPDSLPTGVPITSQTINLDTIFRQYDVPFSIGGNPTNNFLLSLEYGSGLFENDTILVGISMQGDGQGEHLSKAYKNFSGTSIWLDHGISNPGFDRDAMLFPQVSYSLTTDFQIPGDSVCIDENLLFTNLSTWVSSHRMYNRAIFNPGQFGNAYTWNFGDGNTSTDMDPLHTYSSLNDYPVQLTAKIVGANGNCQESSISQLSVQQRPVAGFTADKFKLDVGDTLFITDMSSGGQNCIWEFGDTLIYGCGDKAFVFDSAGVYNITQTVLSPYGCEEVSSQNVQVGDVVSRGIEKERQNLLVYPNPCQAVLNLRLSGQEEAILMYSLQGNLIKTFLPENQKAMSLDVSSIPQGIYLLAVQFRDGAVQTNKIVISE